MSTFALDKNYQQFNFEEITVEDLMIVSGGSGADLRCLAGTVGGALTGALGGAGIGSIVPWLGTGFGAVYGGIGGGLTGYATFC